MMEEEDSWNRVKTQREGPGILAILAAIVGEDDLPAYNGDWPPEKKCRYLQFFCFKSTQKRRKPCGKPS